MRKFYEKLEQEKIVHTFANVQKPTIDNSEDSYDSSRIMDALENNEEE